MSDRPDDIKARGIPEDAEHLLEAVEMIYEHFDKGDMGVVYKERAYTNIINLVSTVHHSPLLIRYEGMMIDPIFALFTGMDVGLWWEEVRKTLMGDRVWEEDL